MEKERESRRERRSRGGPLVPFLALSSLPLIEDEDLVLVSGARGTMRSKGLDEGRKARSKRNTEEMTKTSTTTKTVLTWEMERVHMMTKEMSCDGDEDEDGNGC